MTARSLPHWLRRLAGEWERAVFGALAATLVMALALGLLELGRGTRGADRQTREPGRFRESFHPGAFAFLDRSAWPQPATNPFARPVAGPARMADTGLGQGAEPGKASGGDPAGDGATGPVQGDGVVSPLAVTSVFYHGCFRTGTGAELAYLTVRRAGGCTPEILAVSQPAAGGELVRFSPAALVLRVGAREYAIPRGTAMDVP